METQTEVLTTEIADDAAIKAEKIANENDRTYGNKDILREINLSELFVMIKAGAKVLELNKECFNGTKSNVINYDGKRYMTLSHDAYQF